MSEVKDSKWRPLVVIGVILLVGAGILVWHHATATLSVEDKYAADVHPPSFMKSTGVKSFPDRNPPAQVWYYTSSRTPGNIVQGLQSSLQGQGFSTKTANGKLQAANKELNLQVDISRQSAQSGSGYTVAITATEVK